MAGITEKQLEDLATELGNDSKLVKLGLDLGLQHSRVKSYLATNTILGEVSSRGTSTMLFDWKRQTPLAEQASSLKKALDAAGLTGVAEKTLFAEGKLRTLRIF